MFLFLPFQLNFITEPDYMSYIIDESYVKIYLQTLVGYGKNQKKILPRLELRGRSRNESPGSPDNMDPRLWCNPLRRKPYFYNVVVRLEDWFVGKEGIMSTTYTFTRPYV